MSPKATILVVEDDFNLMQGIRDILELQDYQVLTANNGEDGLRVMRNVQTLPDLIVSDIMMPRLNGYEFLEAVRAEVAWARIPFIFLTARGERADIRAGKSMGVDDYMVKPFNAEDLLIVVEGKLRRRQELENIHSAEISDIKRSILTILNHEFRTPLTYIVAYADMLNQDTNVLNYEEMRTFLRGMNTGADRLRRLVENFILLVELETGEARKIFALRKTRIDYPWQIATAAAEECLTEAEEKPVSIMVEPPDTELPSLDGDSEYLRLALVRLIENAIKFTAEAGRTITLSAYADDWLHFVVRDQGRGIPAEEQQAIFEPFYQIDRSTFEDQGAGIGLPIVRRIAELHGGTVSVESVIGQGSRFILNLPL